MKRIVLQIDDDLDKRLLGKAKSLGLTRSAFLRMIIETSIIKAQSSNVKEISILFEGLIFCISEAFGRTHKASREDIQLLTEKLIQLFKEKISYDKHY